ncbi:hypothetical protein ACFOKI_06655 [Sphingomonas qilianensis]|uniref:Uncharacterized protein n=1 Tax=Sphingomonas qilianensis TaxID=1736690 RepID=A0ABU9XQH3_9SPHN
MTMTNMINRLGKLEAGSLDGGPKVKVAFIRNDEPTPTPDLDPSQKLIVVRFVSASPEDALGGT